MRFVSGFMNLAIDARACDPKRERVKGWGGLDVERVRLYACVSSGESSKYIVEPNCCVGGLAARLGCCRHDWQRCW